MNFHYSYNGIQPRERSGGLTVPSLQLATRSYEHTAKCRYPLTTPLRQSSILAQSHCSKLRQLVSADSFKSSYLFLRPSLATKRCKHFEVHTQSKNLEHKNNPSYFVNGNASESIQRQNPCKINIKALILLKNTDKCN